MAQAAAAGDGRSGDVPSGDGRSGDATGPASLAKPAGIDEDQ